MAKVVRHNPLTHQKIGVADMYDLFLRSRRILCAKTTIAIYEEIGNRVIVPGLIELTGDDMNAVTENVLRTLLSNYEANHAKGGMVFLFRHLRTFINWYWDEYEVPVRNPISRIKVKNPSTPPKQGISREDVDKLIKTAKEKSVFPERDIAMLMVLCDTGIRRTSLASLKMSNVNVARCEMTVFEKDQQYHIKAFGAATCKAIKKYLACLVDIKPEDPFWLCMDGTVLTWKGMREVLRRLCAEAGIGVHHFHDFRRFYALELYNSTHDIYLVSRALDHKDIEVTKRYIALDEKENTETLRTYSPMDRRAQQTGAKVQRG